MPDTFIPQIMQ